MHKKSTEQAAEPIRQSPFERFNDLTRRIVAVPKADIEERKAKKRDKRPPKSLVAE